MSDFDFPYCPTCVGNFPMRGDEYQLFEENGEPFYCPKGHRLFVSQSSISRSLRSEKRSTTYLRKQMERMCKTQECLRGVQTRMKNRLLRGDCPICGKKTNDVVSHVQKKHRPKVA